MTTFFVQRKTETNKCHGYWAQCYPPSVWTEDKTAKLLFSVRNPNPKSKPNPNPSTNLVKRKCGYACGCGVATDLAYL